MTVEATFVERGSTRSGAQNARRERLVGFLVILAAVPALLVLVLPVIPVVVMSFTSSGVVKFPPSNWGFGAYRDLIHAAGWLEAFWFSLRVAMLAVLFACIAGTLASIGMSRGAFRARGLCTAVILVPLSIPLVVLGLSTFQFYVRYRMNGTLVGIAFVHAVIATPYVYMTVRAALSQLDESLVRSAMSLGAGVFSVLRWIYLPALRPAIVSGAVLAFGVSFDEVVIALFLSGPNAITLPVKMFTEIQFDLSPVIMAVSTLLLVIEVVAVAIGTFVVVRRYPTKSQIVGF